MRKKEFQRKLLERLENIDALLSDILSVLTPPEVMEDEPQLLNEEELELGLDEPLEPLDEPQLLNEEEYTQSTESSEGEIEDIADSTWSR